MIMHTKTPSKGIFGIAARARQTNAFKKHAKIPSGDAVFPNIRLGGNFSGTSHSN
jgi:hypothetical protein